jgi:photosystem II stability/assembly factor-like uncharacterized protein
MEIERPQTLLTDDEWHRTKRPEIFSAAYVPPRLPRRLVLRVGAAIIAAVLVVVVSVLLSGTPLFGFPVSLAGSQFRVLLPVNATTYFAVIDVGNGDYGLARTSDGGGQWTARRLPTQVNRGLWAYEPVLLGPESLLIGAFVTRDGGWTWTMGKPSARRPPAPPLQAGAPVQVVPKGWPLRPYCLASCELSAVDPATGTPHVVGPMAGVRIGDNAVDLVHDDVLWVKTVDRIYFSLDAGKSWSSREIRYDDTFSFGALGGYAYVLTDVYFDGTSVLRTVDGGRSWQTVASDIQSPVIDLCVLRNGDVLAVVLGGPDRRLMISRDRGETFQPMDDTISVSGLLRALDGTCVVKGRGAHWVVAGGALSAVPMPFGR